MLQISELYIYPVKSLPGIAVTKATVTERGFEYDRRWMLIDENNRFISQRESAEMTQLEVAILDVGLKVTHRLNKDSIIIPFCKPGLTAKNAVVSIWDDICTAEYVSQEADKWFTDILGIKCRLVYMPDSCKRVVDQKYAPEDAVTSFSDAYPYLIIGQSSLDDLNSRLIISLPMNRFRPNIVFTGGEPFEEDKMGQIVINGINFYGLKLCARCNIIAIDQLTGIQEKEPSKTLASYRFKNNKILFGQNLIAKGNGVVSVGDMLNLISVNTEERFFIEEKNVV